MSTEGGGDQTSSVARALGDKSLTRLSPDETHHTTSTRAQEKIYFPSDKKTFTDLGGISEPESAHILSKPQELYHDRSHTQLHETLTSDIIHVPKMRKKPVSNVGIDDSSPRQVIAVSASKGPAAFFNLARKFLVTDEMCDLSALEGAIVSAVDAAHLLERSKLASIVRVQTSYVAVEPKRRKQLGSTSESADYRHPGLLLQATGSQLPYYAEPSLIHKALIDPTQTRQATPRQQVGHTTPMVSRVPSAVDHEVVSVTSEGYMGPGSRKGRVKNSNLGGRELRRARIIITVKRSEDYRRWLDENPVQAIIAADGDEEVIDPRAISEG